MKPSKKKLIELTETLGEVLVDELNHVRLPADRPILFVGDLHGDVKIARAAIERYLKTHRLVFVGDYVDRAPEPFGSPETIQLVFETKLADPDRVILLRGNHEFGPVFRDNGFGDALLKIEGGGEELIEAFEEVFSLLPYVATTANGVLCLHGGLPNVEAAEEALQLPKGVKSVLDHRVVSQTVWNDNVLEAGDLTAQGGFEPSDRVHEPGFSILYGEPYFSEKMALFDSKVLVRGHDHRVKGYSLGDRVLTLLTGRQYAEEGNVKGAFAAELDPQAEIKTARDLTLKLL